MTPLSHPERMGRAFSAPDSKNILYSVVPIHCFIMDLRFVRFPISLIYIGPDKIATQFFTQGRKPFRGVLPGEFIWFLPRAVLTIGLRKRIMWDRKLNMI